MFQYSKKKSTPKNFLVAIKILVNIKKYLIIVKHE